MMAMIAMMSCGGNNTTKEESESGERAYKSQAYKLVESNINEMAKKPWNKSAYVEIRDSQITVLRKNSEQISAQALLDTEYGNLMARDAKGILQAGCPESNSHKLLDQLLAELRSYPNATGLKEVKELKAVHDKAASFANSGVGYQAVANYRTPYDKSYETRKMSEARSWLNNPKLKCKSIKSRLERLTSSSAYTSRRYAYCQAIVDSYLQCTNPKPSERNQALGNIDVYEGNKSAWNKMIEDHYKELNANQSK